MLLSGLLGLLCDAMEWIIGLFPTANVDMSWLDGLGRFFGSAMLLDQALPIHEILLCLTVYGVVVIGMHGGNLVRRILSVFTGGGGA